MKLEEIIKNIKPANMDTFMLKTEEFEALFKANKVQLVDVRMKFETEVWNLPIALNIPANEIANRLDELPKDKLIVTACPNIHRSMPVSMYLKSQGYESKYLKDGLISFMGEIKGGKAKELLER